jgi:hypothetical protein
MSRFFIAVFTIYGGAHVYVFLRARSAFKFGAGPGIALALFMLLMVGSPFLIRSLELQEFERAARSLAYVAYTWMAVLLLFFSGSVILDLAGLAVRLAGWLTRSDLSSFLLSGRTSFLACLSLAVIISFYGYFEARGIRTERVRIETGKLPAGVDRLTIVQISDVHLGLIVRKRRLERILGIVEAAKPDILVSTGDLVDAQINHLTGLAGMLRGVRSRFGKYAITGNHEYYAGIGKAIDFTQEAGFTVLRNATATAGPITLVGVDDRTGVQLNRERPIVEKDILAKLPRDKFILFMKHQPRIDRESVGLFDLQISGHTHKGQIFPFTFLTQLTFPMIAGDYDLGKGSLLHVSRGTGTWGPPIRFLAPPEVTVYELVRKEET